MHTHVPLPLSDIWVTEKKSFWIQSAYSYPRDLSLPLLMIVYTLDTFNLLIREETYLSSHRKHLLVVVVVTNWVFQNPVFRSFFGEYLNVPPIFDYFCPPLWKLMKNYFKKTLFQFTLKPKFLAEFRIKPISQLFDPILSLIHPGMEHPLKIAAKSHYDSDPLECR